MKNFIFQLAIIVTLITICIAPIPSISQTKFKPDPNYKSEYKAFVQDYYRALELMMNLNDDLSKEELATANLECKELMDQAKEHFQYLVG